MFKKSDFPSAIGFAPEVTRSQPVDSRFFNPAVPVLPETLLLLELESQQSPVDLRRFCQIVLSDLGATIQIFKLAARESCYESVTRIEDCVAMLGIERSLSALEISPSGSDINDKATEALWSHSARVAYSAQQVAANMSDVCPAEAYLVGLLHGIGSLPQALGWFWMLPGKTPDAVMGRELANRWGLPEFVRASFVPRREAVKGDPWAEIVSLAHQLSDLSHLTVAKNVEVRFPCGAKGRTPATLHVM